MWEIFAYHNSASLFGIFNAVAAIMTSTTFAGILAAVGYCGFAVALIGYAFAPEKMQGWRWLGTVVLVYAVLFLPRVTVGIVDKTGGAPVQVVDNVPFGMAALGGLTSTIGNAMTELFETAFQTIPGPGSLPTELAYQRNGLMFGSRLLQETRRASFPDPGLRQDLQNFANNCTYYDIADGTIKPETFSQSPDLWSLMANTNPARFSTVTTSTGIGATTCDQVYASIDSRLPAQTQEILDRLASRMQPSVPTLMAQAAIVGQVEQAYIRSQIADSSSTATNLIRQNAMINVLDDASQLACRQVSDPSCMMMATARANAVAQQNASWINGAKVAEQALPIVRNVVEAMLYAIFPLIVVMLFLTNGRSTLLLLGNYAALMVSIQLWPPLFAILNYMASIYAQFDQAAAAQVGGGLKALSMQTASPIYANAVSAQAVVALLMTSIPFLAYGVANRLVNVATHLTGGLSGLQNTVASATNQAALGNASMGDVTMDQRVISPSTSNPWVTRQQNLEGSWLTSDGKGRTAISLLRNEGVASHIVSAEVSQSMVNEASKSAESAHSEMVSAQRDQSAALTEAVHHASSRISSVRNAQGTGNTSSEDIGQQANQIDSISKSVAQATGMSSSQVQKVGFGWAASFGIPAIPMSPLKAGVSQSLDKAYTSGLSADERKIRGAMSTEQLQAFKSFSDRVTRDTSYQSSLTAEGREGHDLASRLASTTSRLESSQSNFAQRQSLAERLSQAHTSGEAIRIDQSQLPSNADFAVRYARLAQEYGNSTQALQIALANELATYALPPTRNFKDGSVAPSSAEDLRALHAAQANEPQYQSSAVDTAARTNQAKLTTKPTGDKKPLHAAPSNAQSNRAAETDATHRGDGREDLRHEITDDRDRLKGQTQVEYDSFDKRHEIKRHQDGTVSSNKSEVVKNANQIKDDATRLLENAKQFLNRKN